MKSPRRAPWTDAQDVQPETKHCAVCRNIHAAMSILTMMSETKNNRREQSTICIFSSKTSCDRATADVDDERGVHIIDHKAGMTGQKIPESIFALEMREIRERL